MLEEIKKRKGQVGYVIVFTEDRFARNTQAALEMEAYLKDIGVDLKTIDTPISTTGYRQNSWRKIKYVIAEEESLIRGERARNGISKSRKNGRWPHLAPKGFKKIFNESGKKILVPDENAPFIRQAYEKVSERISPESVRKQLKKKGFKCSKSYFYAMLQKPIYAGEIEVFDEETGEFLHMVKGNHQEIVSKELFQKVQDIFNQSKRKGIKARQVKENFPLQGYLICHKCNEVLDISSNNASRNQNFRHSYYCCRACKGKDTWHNINKIHENFLMFLRALKPKPQILEGFNFVMEYVFKSSAGNQKLELSRIDEKLKTMEQKRRDATTKFVEGHLEQEDFNLFKESLKEEKLTLEHRKSELKEMD